MNDLLKSYKTKYTGDGGGFHPPGGLGLNKVFYLNEKNLFRYFKTCITRYFVDCVVVDKTYANIMEFLMFTSFKLKRKMEEDSTSKMDLFICDIM